MFGWIFRSLVVNEYQSGKYDTILPGTDGLTKGEAILTQFGFTQDGEPFEFEWVWYVYFNGCCFVLHANYSQLPF